MMVAISKTFMLSMGLQNTQTGKKVENMSIKFTRLKSRISDK